MRLRFKLYVMVAASMVPVAAILFQNHAERAEARASAAYEASMDQAVGVGNALSQLVTGMKYLLMTVSRAPVIKSGGVQRCRDYVASVRKEFPDTVALGAADLAGNVYCNSLPLASPVNISDRAYFKKALAEERFVAGEPVSGRATGRQSITFAYPVRDDAERRIGVLFVAIGLQQLAEQLAVAAADPGFTLVVTDPHGTIVLDLPAGGRVGERLGEDWRRLMAHGTPVAAEVEESNRPQIVAAVPLEGDAAGLFVIAARDKAEAFASAAQASRRDALLLGLALLWALVLTWMISHLFIERPATQLLDAARAWASGDYAVRAVTGTRSEFGTLARVFNVMAESVQARDRDMNAAQRSLSEARDAALRASRSKSAFLAAVSHDLRQPLTALTLGLGSAETWAVADQHKRTIARMKRSTVVIEELLDSLVDLAKLESGKLKPSPAVFCAATALHALQEEFAPIAENMGLTLRVGPCASYVESDPRLLGRILRNLVSNAIKFTPAGGRVSIDCVEEDGRVGIRVQDTGIGIPLERQQEVFEEFLQLEAPSWGPEKGLGLGLAIVKRLADLLHHEIGLRSSPGKGSTFTITVPAAESEPRQACG